MLWQATLVRSLFTSLGQFSILLSLETIFHVYDIDSCVHAPLNLLKSFDIIKNQKSQVFDLWAHSGKRILRSDRRVSKELRFQVVSE